MIHRTSPILKGRCFFLVMLLGLVGCETTRPLLPNAKAPDADEVNRPAWASRVTGQAPEDAGESAENAVEPLPDSQAGEPKVEEKESGGGFWSFLSRNKDAEEDVEEARTETGEDGEADMPEDNADIGEQDPEAEPEPVDLQDDNKVYRLKAGDVVMITLTGSGGLNEQLETVIAEEGNVKLRYIGAVQAGGLTPAELEREIEAEYTERQKIYKSVVARVVVPNRFYFIGEEVRSPGRYPIVGKVTLSQAISAAGNFTEWANEKRVVLVRGNAKYEIDFREIKDDPSQDIVLQPGDNITVKRRILF